MELGALLLPLPRPPPAPPPRGHGDNGTGAPWSREDFPTAAGSSSLLETGGPPDLMTRSLWERRLL